MKLIKKGVFLGLVALIGCGTVPNNWITPPTETNVVVGGINNLQPYFGKLQSVDRSLPDMGDFLLASCGCGDWRVLIRPNNGDPQVQFPVRFFSNGVYDPNAEVAVYGTDEDKAFSGRLKQDTGNLSGNVLSGQMAAFVDGARGDAHVGRTVDACIMCHVGDDPIFPLPSWHNTIYYSFPEVCLHCHSANGQ